MGQKTNPIGFRLGIVKPWVSRYFAAKDLPGLLKEDELIRKYLLTRLGHAAIAEIHIERRPQKVTVTIHTGRPGVVIGKKGAEVDKLRDELRAHIASDLRWEKYVNQQVTDKTLQDYFAKNSDMFDGSMVRARHILLTPAAGDPQGAAKTEAELRQLRQSIEQKAAEGMAKLPANADTLAREKARSQLLEDAFAQAATVKSACPSKEQGGDVGFFPRAGSMVEPFARAAFALKPHQMSDVVATPFGFHLILATERRPGKPTKFEETKDAVREVYADRVLREGLLAQLRPKAKITITPVSKP